MILQVWQSMIPSRNSLRHHQASMCVTHHQYSIEVDMARLKAPAGVTSQKAPSTSFCTNTQLKRPPKRWPINYRPDLQLSFRYLLFYFPERRPDTTGKSASGVYPPGRPDTAVKPALDVYPPRRRPDTTGNPASDF